MILKLAHGDLGCLLGAAATDRREEYRDLRSGGAAGTNEAEASDVLHVIPQPQNPFIPLMDFSSYTEGTVL